MLQLPETDEPLVIARRAPRSPAQVAAGDAAIVDAFRKMEYTIEDMVQMTSIASTLIESYEQEAIAVGSTPRTAAEAMKSLRKTGDQLRFMTYEIEQRALALQNEWHAAASAGDHTFTEPEDHDTDDESIVRPRPSAPRQRTRAPRA